MNINLYKGISKNLTLGANSLFFSVTSLPKYSFSPAKLRFWCLVSEENPSVIISNRVIRDALWLAGFKSLISVNSLFYYKDHVDQRVVIGRYSNDIIGHYPGR